MNYDPDLEYIVTSGSSHIDIDALACGAGMSELLTRQGFNARFVSGSPLNATVPASIRALPDPRSPAPDTGSETRFIVCDTSDPGYFDKICIPEQISEIIDHHFGFEEYWQNRPEVASDIKPVGACASQVTSRFMEAGLLPLPATARLLVTAILSNTLDLKLRLTHSLDHAALDFLRSAFPFGPEYSRDYFRECQKFFLSAPLKNLLLDIKTSRYGDRQLTTGQIEIWDRKDTDPEQLFHALCENRPGHDILLTTALVGETCNSLISNSESLLKKIAETYPGQRSGNCFETSGLLLLRKEIHRDLGITSLSHSKKT